MSIQTVLSSVSSALHPESIYQELMSIESKERKLTSDDAHITEIFNCSPFIDAKTKQVTTQKGVRFIVDDLLSRHYNTKQATLKYPQLDGRHKTFYRVPYFLL
jgi:hypothetical protein